MHGLKAKVSETQVLDLTRPYDRQCIGTRPVSLDNRRGLKFMFKKLVGNKRHWLITVKLFHRFLRESDLREKMNASILSKLVG